MRVRTILIQLGAFLRRVIVPPDPLLRGTSVSRQMWAALTVGPWGSALAALILVFAAYLDCATLGYAPADRVAVLENPVARGDTPLATVFGAPTSTDGTGLESYQPLALLSQRLEQALAPAEPLFAHRISVGLHAVNTLLLLALMRRLSNHQWLVRAVTCLFATQPLSSSSVGYLVGRGQLLATLGVLASLYLFIRSGAPAGSGAGTVVADPDPSSPRCASLGRWLPLFLGPVAAAFGLFSAESALVLPWLLAGYLLAFEPSAGPRRWLGVGAHVAVVALYLVARQAALQGWGIPPAPDLLASDHLRGLLRHLGAMIRIVLVPTEVDWMKSLAIGQSLWNYVFFGLAGLGILTAGLSLSLQRRRLPWAWFGMLWVILFGLPLAELSLRIGTAPESWLYLPSIGLWLTLATLVIATLQYFRWPRFFLRWAGIGCGVLLLVWCGRTSARLRDWRGQSAPLEITLRPTIRAARFHYRVGLVLLRAEESKSALQQLRVSLTIEPRDLAARTQLALTLHRLGERDEALENLRELLEERPDDADLLLLAGGILAEKRYFREARQFFERMIRVGAPSAAACNSLGWLLATSPDPAVRNGREALQWAQRALQLAGEDDPESLDTLAAAYAEIGNFVKAVPLAQKASQITAKQGDYALSGAMLDREKLYNAHRPYRGARNPTP
ncbi:hypothetical protein HQ590_08755 [bacterium]|nr:hypothetical protein [bacterium]